MGNDPEDGKPSLEDYDEDGPVDADEDEVSDSKDDDDDDGLLPHHAHDFYTPDHGVYADKLTCCFCGMRLHVIC